MNENTPITHGGSDRGYKQCKCYRCGIVEVCTPARDFYTIDSATGPLWCETCFWLRKSREARQKQSGITFDQ